MSEFSDKCESPQISRRDTHEANTSTSDINQVVPVKWLNIVTIVGIIGLIIGIAGVSTASDNGGSYQPTNTVKASMAIFIALFVIYHLLAAFMYLQMGHLKAFQKKLFLSIIFSTPFILVRVVYAAIGDFTTIERFSIISTNGSPTIYLVMDVLEEIVAMAITMFWACRLCLSLTLCA